MLAAGLVLSLNSGFINGLCLSGLLTEEGSHKQSVAVTGSYIRSGLALANGMYDDFVFAIALILAFAGGATVSSLINPNALPHRLDPSYGPNFLLGSLCLIAASIAAYINPSGRAQYFFAAATNGMQNGMSSMYTANVSLHLNFIHLVPLPKPDFLTSVLSLIILVSQLIRTASHGGTTTDIGLILGQMIRGNWKNFWKFKVLSGLASSFWVGGFISFYSASSFAHYSFWFSAGLYMTIGLSHLTFVVLTQKVSFFQASIGTWKWDAVLEQMAVSMTDRTGSASLSAMTTEQIDCIFDLIDADGSGKINADELKDALELMGIRLSRSNILAMMAAVDENGDGEIDSQEFHSLIRMAIMRSTQKKNKKDFTTRTTSSTWQGSVEDSPSPSTVAFCVNTAQTSRSDCEEKTELDNSMRHCPPHAYQEALPRGNGHTNAIIVIQAKYPHDVVGITELWAWEDLCGYKSFEAVQKCMSNLIDETEINVDAIDQFVNGTAVSHGKDGTMLNNLFTMMPLYAECNGTDEEEGLRKALYYVGILRMNTA